VPAVLPDRQDQIKHQLNINDQVNGDNINDEQVQDQGIGLQGSVSKGQVFNFLGEWDEQKWSIQNENYYGRKKVDGMPACKPEVIARD